MIIIYRVAIKKIKSLNPEEGINFTAVREIKLLREFHHENIIELVECFATPDLAICLVYECCHTDLEKIIKNMMKLQFTHGYSLSTLRGSSQTNG